VRLESGKNSGDSGTSSRVFSMLAQQMGDTQYRGKILWFLLTCRPDLLPIDLKRQGRAEVHIPLFYPDSADEKRKYFAILAKKNGGTLDPESVPADVLKQPLSGADIEGLVVRAKRRALLGGSPQIRTEDLAAVFQNFVPPSNSEEVELADPRRSRRMHSPGFSFRPVPENGSVRSREAAGGLKGAIQELIRGTEFLSVPNRTTLYPVLLRRRFAAPATNSTSSAVIVGYMGSVQIVPATLFVTGNSSPAELHSSA